LQKADAYCVDTSSFLKIFEEYPGATRQRILDGLDALIRVGRLRTVRVVLDEVDRHNQSLSEWVQGHKEQLLLKDDDSLLNAAFQMVRQFPDLYDSKRNRLQADPFLIGAAQINYLVVVADERPRHLRRQRSQNQLHIPDVCAQLGIRCLTLDEMLRAEGII
jgi:hypothetical protein